MVELTLEELKKEMLQLPPKARLQLLKKYEEEEKRRKAEEEKRLEEAEQLLKKTIEEITSEEEEEETTVKERQKEKPKEKETSLEEIAEKEKPKQIQPNQEEYLRQQEYIREHLSRRPASELYGAVGQLRDNFQQRGYLTTDEVNRVQQLSQAFYEKEKAGYHQAKHVVDAAEHMLEQIMDPLKLRNYR